MVVAWSNGSRTAVESQSNRIRVVVVTVALETEKLLQTEVFGNEAAACSDDERAAMLKIDFATASAASGTSDNVTVARGDELGVHCAAALRPGRGGAWAQQNERAEIPAAAAAAARAKW